MSMTTWMCLCKNIGKQKKRGSQKRNDWCLWNLFYATYLFEIIYATYLIMTNVYVSIFYLCSIECSCKCCNESYVLMFMWMFSWILCVNECYHVIIHECFILLIDEWRIGQMSFCLHMVGSNQQRILNYSRNQVNLNINLWFHHK